MQENTQILSPHPLREQLYAEIHARPFPLIKKTVNVLHLAFLTTQSDVAQHLRIFDQLAQEYGLTSPDHTANSFYFCLGDIEIRWEKHQEFCSLTLIAKAIDSQPFTQNLLEQQLLAWVMQLPGQMLVKLALHFERKASQPDPETIFDLFEGRQLYGSSIVDEKASMWSSFRLHSDDRARILIYDNGLSDYQAGRTLQRIIEIETYRILTLLALPIARGLIPEIATSGSALTELIKYMQTDQEKSVEDEDILAELSVHAARIEDHRASTAHRFAATLAYDQIVKQRLNDLREQSWPGFSSWGKMLQRRLVPAVKTCVSIDGQLQSLSDQAERANNLLRTRIDIKIEEQNQKLLKSLDRRSQLQLRLQQTVEGLSVVAISYYLIGLIKAVADGVYKSGVNIDPTVVAAIAVVPVLLVTGWLVRRVKHTIRNQDSDTLD